MQCVIGLDLGTTCVKALLFDEAGCILGMASEDDELITPHQGWVEQKAERWVELSAKVIGDVISDTGVDPLSVNALSVSSQGLTIVPVDREYKPLRNAINWLDTRASREVDFIRSLISDDEMYSITGKSLIPGYSLPGILWLKRNKPEIYSSAFKLLLPHDYLFAHFCGVPVTDHTMAAGTMLYDVVNQQWSCELLDLFEIDIELMPEIKWAGTPIGTITNKISKLVGLSESTIVVNGGQDQKVAAYGASLQKGSSTISFGTCLAMQFMFDHPPSLPSRSLAASSYLMPDAWVLEACINTAGAAIKWARDTLFPDMSYDDMNALAETCATSGGVFFYPHLQGGGTPHNTIAYGTFTGITLSTTRAELIRAIYEGIAMEVYANLCTARDAGVIVNDMYIFGGGSKSAVICRILADMTNCETYAFSIPEMGAFGAAKLAANAIGIDNFTLPVSSVWEPNAAQNARLIEQYRSYARNFPAILNINK